MTNEQLAAIRKRAEGSIGRGPDWDDFEALLDEVERLRNIEAAALAQSEDVQVNWLSPIEAIALRDYVDRLRNALNEIASLPPYGWSAEMCAKMQGIAIDAAVLEQASVTHLTSSRRAKRLKALVTL